MGIVFNNKNIVEGVHHNIIKCPKSIIQRASLNVLTPQNKQFLKNLKLRIRGKSVA